MGLLYLTFLVVVVTSFCRVFKIVCLKHIMSPCNVELQVFYSYHFKAHLCYITCWMFFTFTLVIFRSMTVFCNFLELVFFRYVGRVFSEQFWDSYICANKESACTSWLLKMGSIGRAETSVIPIYATNHTRWAKITLHNIPEERRSHKWDLINVSFEYSAGLPVFVTH
jgi:hypothetical protein